MNETENQRNSYKEKIPPIYLSPFFALAMVFEKNPQVEEMTFSLYPSSHISHKGHIALGYWKRGEVPFAEDNFVNRLGKIVIYDLLEARQFLEQNKDRLPPDLQAMIPSLFEGWKKPLEEYFIGVNSKVLLKNGTYAHIPMIDFSSRITGGLDEVKTALKRLGEDEGYIYNSGRSENSFHYYGAKVLKPRDWQIFCGECLLLNLDWMGIKITDDRYVGHRVVDGFGCLRISTNSKKPNYPRLVAHYKAEEIGPVEPLVDKEGIKKMDKIFEGNARLYRKVKRGEPLIKLF